MFHYHKQSILSFDNLVKLNYMRVSDNFENVDFTSYTFNIVDVFDFPFIQYFDCDFLSSVNMISLLYFSKCSLTESFLYFVIADHFVSFFHMNVNLFLFWHKNFCYTATFVDIFDVTVTVLPHKFRTNFHLWCMMWIIIYPQVISFFQFLLFILLIYLQILKQKEHILRISFFYISFGLRNSLVTVLKAWMEKLIVRFVIVCILNSIFIGHLFLLIFMHCSYRSFLSIHILLVRLIQNQIILICHLVIQINWILYKTTFSFLMMTTVFFVVYALIPHL